MAQIEFKGVAHSYRRSPTPQGLRPATHGYDLGGRRGLRAARTIGLRQDHVAQHHLGLLVSVRKAGADRRSPT